MPSPLIPLLQLAPLASVYLEPHRDRYEVIEASDDQERHTAIREHGERIRAVVTQGTIGLTADEMDLLPSLELICTIGAGYELVDVAAARTRGVAVASAAGANADCVADHAFSLLASTIRDIARFDRGVKQGLWRDQLGEFPPMITGKRVGILGMGDIGRRIAQRCAGFDMPIAYHSRKPQHDLSHLWLESPVALAQWSDCLVVATPGGPATHHLVGARVLEALGPSGVLVNIARGSVVDTAALATALREGHIAAAGIDVYEGEPDTPTVLIDLPNVTITPHIGGLSPESIDAVGELVRANLGAYFAGLPLVTPI